MVDICDFIVPSKRFENKRLWKIGERGIYSAVYLDPERTHDSPCLNLVFDLVQNLYPHQAEPLRFLTLGGAGCCIPLAVSRWFPNSVSTVVEIDKTIVRLAKTYFFPVFDKDTQSRIHLIAADAKAFIRKDRSKYNWIFQDISDGLSIPEEFISLSWMHRLQSRLADDDGVIIVNLGPIGVKKNLSNIFKFVNQNVFGSGFELFLYSSNLICVISKNSAFMGKLSGYRKYHIEPRDIR